MESDEDGNLSDKNAKQPSKETGYSEAFDDALAFAHEIHRHQVRKGKNLPYINHLMAVAALVGSNGGTETQVIAALLHDAIEDCVKDIPDIQVRIREKFGDEVLAIVDGCTDAYEFPKPPWQERKQEYIDHLSSLSDDSPIHLVSLADKLHNARSILRDLRVDGDEIWQMFTGTKEQSIWYYEELSAIFLEKQPGFLANELQRVVDAIKERAGY